MSLATRLNRHSLNPETCQKHGCDSDHKCEVYAYITADYKLIGIAEGSKGLDSLPPNTSYAMILLPFDESQETLEQEVSEAITLQLANTFHITES